jgi:transposase InsO family protein
MDVPGNSDGSLLTPNSRLVIIEDLKTELVERALVMAIGRRRPGTGLIHHSDRGVQYASYQYRTLLENRMLDKLAG